MNYHETTEITFDKDLKKLGLAVVKLLILAAILAAVASVVTQEMQSDLSIVMFVFTTSIMCIPYVRNLASKVTVISVAPGDLVCRFEENTENNIVEYHVVEVRPKDQVVILCKPSSCSLEEVSYGRMIRKYRKSP